MRAQYALICPGIINRNLILFINKGLVDSGPVISTPLYILYCYSTSGNATAKNYHGNAALK